MSNLRHLLMPAALAVVLTQGRAEAQVMVRTPRVSVFVGGKPMLPPPVLVTPARGVVVDPGSPPLVPLETAPRLPVPPVMAAPRAQTLADFAACFAPAPTGGRYEVVLQHPCTCCPVKVCFCLPPGCPKKVRAFKNSVEIRYGLCKAVVIRFLPDGSVRVRD